MTIMKLFFRLVESISSNYDIFAPPSRQRTTDDGIPDVIHKPTLSPKVG